jgi:hypothetical protein
VLRFRTGGLKLFKKEDFMAATPVFVSFDYDHDLDLYNLLVGQSKHEDTPFTIADWSVKDESAGWVDDARRRISRVDQVIVICGQHTGSATGIDVEIGLARDLGKPYFLLAGRASGNNVKPRAALSSDKLYKWTWENLKDLIAGSR